LLFSSPQVGWCWQREKLDWQEPREIDEGQQKIKIVQDIGEWLGWCREREKIDWQESRKFDCRLGRTIFIFATLVSGQKIKF